MTNDNRRPMSPLGRSLFDMMNAINQAYVAGIDVAATVDRTAILRKPVITEQIVRPSHERKDE